MDEPPEECEDEVAPVQQEPQVTSSDPNERKLARRLRIERRIEALRRAALSRRNTEEEGIEMQEDEGEQDESDSPAEKSLVQTQLEKSAAVMDKLITEAYENVTNVRVANESREIDRREIEGINREKLIEALEEEAKKAEEMFEEIADHWSDILKYHDPLAIHDEMESQKEKCEELLRQKDGIIAMLKDEIKKAEINFTNDQKKQNQDITSLTHRIENQIKAMRVAYKAEIQHIDDVIIEERKILIDINNRQWEELYKKRELEEERQVKRKFEQQEEFIVAMDEIRRVQQEKYREIKIRLEKELETIETEFEAIKSAAMMNCEKLDYNFQILKKREDENLVLNSQQKRKINKLQDVAIAIRKRNTEYEEKTNTEIAKLIKDVTKLQNSAVEIKTKAVTLSKKNDEKFQQIWELNAFDANKLVNRIMGIDKILYEQQLGIEWKKPEGVILNQKQLGSYIKAMDILGNEDSKIVTKSKASRTPSEMSKGETKKQHEPPKDIRAYKRLLRHILDRISERSGFLMEKRLEELLKPYEINNQHLVQIDNVFTALGIKEQENIDQLCYFFLPYAKCAICAKSGTPSIKGSEKFSTTALDDTNTSSTISLEEPLYKRIQQTVSQPEDVISNIIHNLVAIEDSSDSTLSESSTTTDECMAPSVPSEKGDTQTITTLRKSVHSTRFMCRFNHPLQVSPAYVIRALREFLAAYFNDNSSLEGAGVVHIDRHETLSRLLSDDDIKLFWMKYKTFFNVGRMRMWHGLFIGLQKYYEMLKDRRKLNDEVLCLRTQNVELKRLLARYDKDEEKLEKPPCAGQREVYMAPYQPKPCRK
nr:dynein regulatory complex protein 1 homolog [Onthophagus taurus]